MFDLSLFRLPTFTGGAVAAFGLSASIFALLLYLVLYVQDVLNYDALGTGVRLLVLSAGTLVDLGDRRAAHVARADARAHRSRARHRRRRAAAHARARRVVRLDAPRPGAARRRVRRRPGEPAAGVHGRRCRRTAARRHGVGHQLDVPAGRHRHRHRPARDAVLQPGEVVGAVPRRRATRRCGRTPPSWRRRSSPARCSRSSRSCPLRSGPRSQRIATTAFADGLNRILLVAAILVIACGVVAFALIRQRDFHRPGAPA